MYYYGKINTVSMLPAKCYEKLIWRMVKKVNLLYEEKSMKTNAHYQRTKKNIKFNLMNNKKKLSCSKEIKYLRTWMKT